MPVSGLKFGTPERLPEASRVFLPAIEYRRRKKFLMMIKPDVFGWDRGSKEYLPTLMKLPLIPGCGGVKKGRDASVAIAWRMRSGYIVLKDGDHRLKVPGDPCSLLAEGRYRTEYLARIGKTNGAGKAYGWSWEGFEMAGKRVIWGEDDDKRRRFQRHIAETLLPAMSPAVRRYMLKMAEGQLRRAQGRKGRGAAAAARVALLTADLVDLYADYKLHTGRDDVDATLIPGSAGESANVDENGDEIIDMGEEAAA